MRITVNVKEEIVKALDEYCEHYGLTRSAGASIMLANALKADKAMTEISELVKFLKDERDRR